MSHYILKCEQHFSYFDPDYPISGLTVTGLARVYCTFISQHYRYGGTADHLLIICINENSVNDAHCNHV
jgi:hypothetical protein